MRSLVLKSRKIIGQVIPELPPEIAEKLHSHGKILLYFFSPNCGPCREMTPRIGRILAQGEAITPIHRIP